MARTEVKEAVNIQVTLRHTNNHREIEQYARDAVQALDKVFSGIVNCHVVLDHQKNDFEKNKLAEITVHIPQNVLVAKEAAAKYEQAIDSCVDSLGRQLRKHKEKLQNHR
ncbi:MULTISPECIES: ribosome hibernation-promoting factor, HPF/YfiA family [Prosthecochloris]|uniref:Ribosomal subunit interface protein n=1 Tax=Prosthecochloris marina TaxID=2017681 RepID=A0A317T4Q0_9CHLB|nr:MULTISPECIES: ribosome-associated translation inhibitor RaiA [Prosthecochloris]PWW81618.1 ribosomal subunit interface protein [Prosthecochloris marina]UZJ37064.1 ribosome-associated translation inhibitor RaiA [Prosthecochloris sp. SCSIO W1103]UZJ40044.1 ribosome-associated translation inhibitor RaiA [Prosthecochloris sp. SCSIO W1102]UZJ40856.1 ribosome-associated translation inhibitor RaiA [Prosthecochloris sp. SCSIO W1101]